MLIESFSSGYNTTKYYHTVIRESLKVGDKSFDSCCPEELRLNMNVIFLMHTAVVVLLLLLWCCDLQYRPASKKLKNRS